MDCDFGGAGRCRQRLRARRSRLMMLSCGRWMGEGLKGVRAGATDECEEIKDLENSFSFFF